MEMSKIKLILRQQDSLYCHNDGKAMELRREETFKYGWFIPAE